MKTPSTQLKRKPPKAPYELATVTTRDGVRIALRGEREVLASLLGYPDLRQADGYVTIPASRVSFMIAEALTAPASVSPGYVRARSAYMSFNVQDVEEMVNALGFERKLFHHQLEFCSLAYPTNGAYNASEQGLAKTATAWTMAHLWNARRTLIVTNKSLALQWAQEQELLTGKDHSRLISCLPLVGKSLQKRREELWSFLSSATWKPKAVVINYESFTALAHLFLESSNIAPWDLLILDEAYRIKNPAAQVTQTITEFAPYFARVLLLAGTPIGNDVGDYYSQMRLLDRNLAQWTHSEFMNRFCRFRQIRTGRNSIALKPDGCIDPAGLMRIIEPYWYRALKATCLDLPPKFYREVRLDFPPDTRRLYNRVDADGEQALGHSLSLADERVVMVRLQQIAEGFEPHYSEETAGWEFRELPCPKLQWLEQWATDTLLGNPTQRAIIWFVHNAPLQRVARHLRAILGEDRVVEVFGETGERELETYKASFNSRHPEGVQVICGQLKKISAGQNLQAGDTHIFHSNSFSHIDRKQAEDRSHRIGRVGPVEYVDLIIRNSIDVDIIKALRNKEELSARHSPETVS